MKSTIHLLSSNRCDFTFRKSGKRFKRRRHLAVALNGSFPIASFALLAWLGAVAGRTTLAAAVYPSTTQLHPERQRREGEVIPLPPGVSEHCLYWEEETTENSDNNLSISAASRRQIQLNNNHTLSPHCTTMEDTETPAKTDLSTGSKTTKLTGGAQAVVSKVVADSVANHIAKERDLVYMWSSLVAGVGSAALASVICAPLDLLRTRMQVLGDLQRHQQNPQLRPSGLMGTIPTMLRQIVAKEGWSGCFRGLGATLVTVPMFWGVYFPLYDDFKRHWTNRNRDSKPALIHMGAAVSAGAIADVILNPMFVVRTRLQTEALHDILDRVAPHRPYSIQQTIKQLYSEGGPLIFWRGMSANLMGLSHVAVQFPTYEALKTALKQHKRHESAFDLLVASGLSKMFASLLTYPHEVIRSRMMDARTATGLAQTCRRIYATEGLLGFYAGLPVTLLRVIPNTCITFITYELLLRWARGRIEDYRTELRLTNQGMQGTASQTALTTASARRSNNGSNAP